jgi:hypothetical protein
MGFRAIQGCTLVDWNGGLDDQTFQQLVHAVADILGPVETAPKNSLQNTSTKPVLSTPSVDVAMTPTARRQGLKNAVVCGIGLLVACCLIAAAIWLIFDQPLVDSFGLGVAVLGVFSWLVFLGTWLYGQVIAGRVLLDCGPQPGDRVADQRRHLPDYWAGGRAHGDIGVRVAHGVLAYHGNWSAPSPGERHLAVHEPAPVEQDRLLSLGEGFHVGSATQGRAFVVPKSVARSA